MIDDDLRRLDEVGVDRPLDRLEADVWRGVAARTQQRAAARRLTSFQSVLMALALLGSVAAGVNVARPSRGAHAVLTTGTELMPSNLLLGERP
jgi:hypothetical protein